MKKPNGNASEEFVVCNHKYIAYQAYTSTHQVCLEAREALIKKEPMQAFVV
jgi:hypothetical protein